MSERTFSPARLALARERRGMSKVALAKAVGVTPKSIIEFESGRLNPSDETLHSFSHKLRFPIGFFTKKEPYTICSDGVSFRALTSMSAGERNKALGGASIAVEIEEAISSHLYLPPPSLPETREGEPEAIAGYVREVWGLGLQPIRNMVHLLEANGIRVFSLNEDLARFDAFAFWCREQPFILLNIRSSGERGRFDAAHELGHLIMHRHGSLQGREAEYQSDTFASAFLMPRSSFVASFPRNPQIANLVEYKKHWGVSLAAVIYRAHQVGVISEWQYRSLFVQLAKHGYRRKEPSPIIRETSQLLTKAFAILFKDGMNRHSFASQLGLTTADFDALTFGLIAFDGGSAPTTIKHKPTLKLVYDASETT